MQAYTVPMPIEEILVLMSIGLVGGLLGGLLGIGGSLVIIPALTLLDGPNQNLYQAAAMIVNVAVAAASTWKHASKGVIRRDILLKMLPFGLVAIVIGVATSNQIDPYGLRILFGLFMIYTAISELLHLVNGNGDHPEAEEGQNTELPATGLVGTVMGFASGLLGIGGGGIAVPMLRKLCRLPLRECIGTSSAVMLITASVGAVQKNLTLPALEATNGDAPGIEASLWLAAMLVPTAVLGSLLGASLMHRLPIAAIRMLFILLMIAASTRMFISG